MNQHASDNARVASTREVDCWENEGGADRAPHQEDSDPPNHEGDATLRWEAKGKKLVTQEASVGAIQTPESRART